MQDYSNKITLGAFISWVFGLLCLIIGTCWLLEEESISKGFTYALIGFFLIPPIREEFHKKTNIAISAPLRFVLVICLLYLAGSFNQENEIHSPLQYRGKLNNDEIIQISDDIWFIQDLANKGISDAQYLLATKYEDGKEIPENKPKALMLYERAAAQGNMYAQYELYGIYAGVVDENLRNPIKSFEYLKMAAENELPQAQTMLANKYDAPNINEKPFDGDEIVISRDYKESFKLKKRAAEQNFSPAFALLAMAYHRGQGVPANNILAYKWNVLAAKEGYFAYGTNEQSLTDQLSNIMNFQAIAEAEKLIEQWEEEKPRISGDFPDIHKKTLTDLKNRYK